MTRLLVARHGETVDNAGGRWQGWGDSPLSARGLAQARALARRLAREPLAAVYSSDLGRAEQTARIAAAPHGLVPRLCPALRERDVGELSGLTGAEVEDRFPHLAEQRLIDGPLDWAPPGGESFRHMLARILPACRDIAAAWAGRTVLVVTHGGVIRLLLAHALGGDWGHIYAHHPTNCGLSELAWSAAGGLTLTRFDECSFLDDVGPPPLASA